MSQIKTKYIADNQVTNPKLAQIATQTIKGRTTGGTGNVEDLTSAQATAILATMVGDSGSGGTKGLAPAPVTGDASKFLRGDATYQSIVAVSNINYIANANAESGTSGWSTYADAAANIPVNGTGGTATGLTFSASASSPLRGSDSFLMAQANSTSLQGKGVSYDFTVDSADLSKPLVVSFDYNASSTFISSDGSTPLNDGTTSANAGNSDIEVFIYDITNGVLVFVSPQVITAKGNNNFSFKGNFQTNANSSSYRLIFHVASTSANATGWNFKFDNVFVGPDSVSHGPAITDWVKYTPVFTGLTVSTNNVYSRRVGDTLEVQGRITVTAESGATATIQLGYNGVSGNVFQDNAKVQAYSLIGHAANAAGASVPNGPFAYEIAADTGNSNVANITWIINGGGAMSPIAGNSAFSPQDYTFDFEIPIAGWSSNLAMSNDSDTRVVAARVYESSGIGITANAIVPFSTIDFDTHANMSSGQYKVPVTGYYSIVGSLYSGTVFGIFIYKNGSSISQGVTSTAGGPGVVTDTLHLIAGDLIDIRSNTSTTLVSSSELNRFEINRIPGPATIAATETVAARVTISSNLSITNGTPILWPVVTKDSHGAYNPSTGIYKIPVSGTYDIRASLYTTAGSSYASIYINGVQYTQGMSNSLSSPGLVSDLIPLIAGDEVTIVPPASQTATAAILNNFSIHRIGN